MYERKVGNKDEVAYNEDVKGFFGYLYGATASRLAC